MLTTGRRIPPVALTGNSGIGVLQGYAPSVVGLNTGTVVMWLRPTYVSGDTNVYYYFDTDDTRHALYHSNYPQFWVDGRFRAFSAASWTANEWSHWAWVYDKASDTLDLYLNGTAVSGDSKSGTWGSTALGANAYLGQRYTQVEGFYPGRMGRVGIFHRMLSPGEIRALSRGMSPTAIRGCRAYWPLVDRPLDRNLGPAPRRHLAVGGLHGAASTVPPESVR